MSVSAGRAAIAGAGMALALIAGVTVAEEQPMQAEKQLTFSAKNHDLDNNDNFSSDGRLLCYDTREMFGPSIDNSTSIELLEIETGREIVAYRPEHVVLGDAPAPAGSPPSRGPSACSRRPA